jgi:hypothetical protein
MIKADTASVDIPPEFVLLLGGMNSEVHVSIRAVCDTNIRNNVEDSPTMDSM